MKNVKTIAALLLCLGLLSPASVLYAAPQGGKVVGGKASITQSGATTTINQTTDRSVINWHSFNIGQNEKFLHNMPSKNSAGLHRVVGGGGASQIQGLLQSNGNIFVVNPAGVVIHKGAKVDTNSFLATTRDITNDNFMKGNMVFDKPGLANAQIINQGTITVNDRGLAALVAPTVRNEGLIVGKLGKVALASGDSTWKLDMYGDDLISFTVDEKAVNGLYAPSGQTLGVENTGTIKAEGGVVVLTAAQLDGIVGSVVNSGEISASSAEVAGGKITFKGHGDSITLTNTGKVDASSTTSKGGSVKMVAENDIKVSGKIDVNGGTAGGDVYIWSDKKTTFDGQIEAKGKDKGGFVETSGNYLKVADSARVYTLADSGRHGEWLLDPVDYIIGTGGVQTGAQLSASLENSNVTIQSGAENTDPNGDVIINDAISWSSDTTLTLAAGRNIEINADITATGNNAGLSMVMPKGNYYLFNDAKITLSGTAPRLSINGNTYTVINSIDALQNMNENLGGKYALGSDLDASITASWNQTKGFDPIGQVDLPISGDVESSFTGHFVGLGHSISNLTINRPLEKCIGLFAGLEGNSVIRDVNIENVDVHGLLMVGSIAGQITSQESIIYNVSVSGKVKGEDIDVDRDLYLGSEGSSIGGITGCNYGTILNTSFSGDVSGDYDIGGLVAFNAGTIKNSATSGSVTGDGSSGIGGFVGFNVSYPQINAHAIIENSYSSSNVYADSQYVSIGGFIGESHGGTIINCYSVGYVSQNEGEFNGSFIGERSGSDESQINLTTCFWNPDTSGNIRGLGGDSNEKIGYPSNVGEWTLSGLSSADMKKKSSFKGWDFENVWTIEEGKSYPTLRNVKVAISDMPPAPPTPPVEPDEPDTPVVPPLTPEAPGDSDRPSSESSDELSGANENPDQVIGDESEQANGGSSSVKIPLPQDIINQIHDEFGGTVIEGTGPALMDLNNSLVDINNNYIKVECAKNIAGDLIKIITSLLGGNPKGLMDVLFDRVSDLGMYNDLLLTSMANVCFDNSQKSYNEFLKIYNQQPPLTTEDLINMLEHYKSAISYSITGQYLSEGAYNSLYQDVQLKESVGFIGASIYNAAELGVDIVVGEIEADINGIDVENLYDCLTLGNDILEWGSTGLLPKEIQDSISASTAHIDGLITSLKSTL